MGVMTKTNKTRATKQRSETMAGMRDEAHIKVRRPNGAIETVINNYRMNDALFAQMVKANKDAGRGELLSYTNVEIDERTDAEIEWSAIGSLYGQAEDAADYYPHKQIQLRNEATARRAAWQEQYPAEWARKQAEGYHEARNHHKAGAGRKAIAKLDAGEDYKTVIVEMIEEWEAYCSEAD